MVTNGIILRGGIMTKEDIMGKDTMRIRSIMMNIGIIR
jgi:hypothetical protein